jgi:8-oxo-dGTP pyrophosphatase MutT (NUDIX family)
MAKIIEGHRVGRNGTIRVGCSAVIFDKDREKILLTRREDNNQWCLPSGGMEPGESASETCIREVDEETGLQVVVKRLIGVYTTPHELIVYQDGNKIQLVALCFTEKYGDYVKSSHRLMRGGYRAMRVDESVIFIFTAWFR